MDEPEREAELAKLRKLTAAYIAVFGEIGKPTPMGELILNDLEAFTAFRRESLAVTKDGSVCPYATIYRDGKQAVMKRVYERIRWRENVDDSRERNSTADTTAARSGS